MSEKINNLSMELSDEELNNVAGGRRTVADADLNGTKYCPRCRKKVSYTSFAGGRDLCNICKAVVTSEV